MVCRLPLPWGVESMDQADPMQKNLFRKGLSRVLSLGYKKINKLTE
jgi:hypothetical protein